MRLRIFIPQENVPDIQVDQHQIYQLPDTTDEPYLFSTHIPTNTPCQDHQSEEEFDHETENPQEILLLLQPEAEVPPSLPEPATTIPTPHSTPPTIPLALREDVPVVTYRDDLPSSETAPSPFNGSMCHTTSRSYTRQCPSSTAFNATTRE